MQIEILGVQMEFERKNIRTLRLTVRRDGSIRLSAPYGLSQSQIDRFVADKLGWIEKQRRRFEALPTPQERSYTSGETLWVFGESYRLTLLEGGTRYSLLLDSDTRTAHLCARAGSTPEGRNRFVREWYRERLGGEIESLLPKWEAITGLSPACWQIKDMRTRWGTCNMRTRKLWFSLRLAERHTDALEYIILHELCHLRVPNHGPDFVALMDTYMPSWREVRARLNQELPLYPTNEKAEERT